jgi:TonB family protein
MKLYILALSLFSSVLIAEPKSSSSVELVETVIPAKPLEREPPRYPTIAARNGNEGWVHISFVVDEKGAVVDPVIEDSSGISSFEKASLRAIKQWQYSPAIRNGENIEQCRNSVQLDFRLDKAKNGGRKRFVRAYKQAEEALKINDILLAEQLIAKMDEGKIWNSYEDTWFWMLKYKLAKAQGNEQSQLSSIRRVGFSGQSSEHIGEGHYISLLRQKFTLELKASLLSDALETFEKIRQRPDSEKIVSALQDYASQARQILKSDDFIVVQGEIGSDGDWWHSLSRNRFSFSDIIGTIDSVELRCANKREKYTVAEDAEWIIPESWGRCRIMVVGDSRANFNLVEIRHDV